MEIVLIGGLWLDRDVWRPVEERGHRAVPLMLPGQGDGNATATLEDQRAAVIAAVDAASGSPMVVGHSAACTLAWMAADLLFGGREPFAPRSEFQTRRP